MNDVLLVCLYIFSTRHIIGRDDLRFSTQIFSASPQIVSVTKRNTLDYMGIVGVGPYTPHKCYLHDRIVFTQWKNRILVSCSYSWTCWLPYSPKLPQLPRETLWIRQIRSWVWRTPPTSAHIVTENENHWAWALKTIKSGSRTHWNSSHGYITRYWVHLTTLGSLGGPSGDLRGPRWAP